MKPYLITTALCIVLASADASPTVAQVDQLYAGIGRSTEGWTVGAGAGFASKSGLLSVRVLGSRKGLFSQDGAGEIGLLYGYPIRIRDVLMVSISAGIARTVVKRRGDYIDNGGPFSVARYEQDKAVVIGIPFQLRLVDQRGATLYLFGNANHEQSYYGFMFGITFQ